MRLFNFIIDTNQKTNTGVTETIGVTPSSLDIKDPGKVAVSMASRDTSAASSTAHGGYNIYQTITPTKDGRDLLISGSLSARPDGIAYALSADDSITDVISIGQKHKFEG